VANSRAAHVSIRTLPTLALLLVIPIGLIADWISSYYWGKLILIPLSDERSSFLTVTDSFGQAYFQFSVPKPRADLTGSLGPIRQRRFRFDTWSQGNRPEDSRYRVRLANGFGFHFERFEYVIPRRGTESYLVVVPHWFLVVSALVIPFSVGRGMRRLRTAYRLRHGKCYACGYNVTKTPERCPECGTQAPLKRQTAQQDITPEKTHGPDKILE
jgi:hypothetical protein